VDATWFRGRGRQNNTWKRKEDMWTAEWKLVKDGSGSREQS